MRTLLVNPPTPELIANKDYYMPSSLLYLAAVLECVGEDVEILDMNVVKGPYDEVLAKRVRSFQPMLVGIGCLFCGQFPALLDLSKNVKEWSEECKVVIGGVHPTAYPDEILTNCPSIDYVVLGEGETAIIQLTKGYDIGKIDGLAYRSNGRIEVNQKTTFIHNLDAIPIPAYDLVNLEDYYQDTSHWHNPKKLPINTSIPIITSRSCPNRCNFCSMFTVMGPTWRCRSPENVVNEIEYLYNNYNHRHFSFMDDNITLNKHRIMEICNLIIRRNLNIQFELPNGLSVRTLDKEVLNALITAGLTRAALGIESGSDYIRNKVIGKKLPRKKILETVRLTKEYKQFYVKAFFIMGMPEDTKETLMETYDMIEEIDVDMPQVFNLLPFPGTKVFEQAMRDNLFINVSVPDLWKSDMFYGSGNRQFFIKPYEMELEDLYEFRSKFDKLLREVKK